ncbi:MAG TPA: carbohydrate ABC transporter permease [Ilumatobacteraceae bacterium]|jgi:raffinose/stachyose/melibiose transport system permease protein|nr:carbohydrate ABC transporter permease [Ilumatobacteraceae bacterium]
MSLITDSDTGTEPAAVIDNIVAPRGSSARRKRAVRKSVSYAILIIFGAFYIGPLLILIFASLKSLPEFFKNPTGLPESFSLTNFTEAWDLANFPRFLMNSLIYTSVATALFVVMSVFVAFPIARGYVRGAGAMLTLYVVALFLPPALIPQFQLILNLGLYNTRQGYILLFLINPIGLIILVNYIKSIPRELDESAAIDGCGYVRFVWSILIPLIKPAIATVTVIHAIGIWNELILATVYLTDEDLYPITRGLIVFEGVYGSDWPKLAAAVLMLMFPMLVLFMFLQRFIISGLTSGAVKG